MWSNINVINRGRDEKKRKLRYEIRRKKGKSEKWEERRGKMKAKLEKKWEIKQEKLLIIITMIIARSSTKVLHSILQICSLPHFPTRTKPHHFTELSTSRQKEPLFVKRWLVGFNFRFQFKSDRLLDTTVTLVRGHSNGDTDRRPLVSKRWYSFWNHACSTQPRFQPNQAKRGYDRRISKFATSSPKRGHFSTGQ